MTSKPYDDPLATGGAINLFRKVSAEEDARFIGRELGGYRITDLIGQGGMSRVYRAERVDGKFERAVAIKVSATGSFNERMRRQFATEQDILASLNHPNISQLYDAQLTEEGWPYIVMELVDGVSVTDFVERRRLSARARVRLLVDIVNAVAYAHGRLFVHRDLKPSNVMVNGDGQPKLLDFGIARLIEGDATEFTRAGAMTLRYASPEQLLGQSITVASDIYQLGLLIFEVLCGEPVYHEQTMTEAVQRAAHGRNVTLPAAAATGLPREIRLVIEQCLRPVADERYPDANALANDLRAWLAGFPVAAAGQSAGYRFRKLIARNKAAAITAVFAVLSLTAGVSWYTWQLSVARTEADAQAAAATSEAEKAERVSQFLIDVLEAPNPDKALGADVTVREVLDSGVDRVRRELADDRDLQAQLLYIMGNVYNELGEFDRSGELISESVAIRRTMSDEDPFALGLALYEQARFHRFQGERERASELLAEALTYARRQDTDDALHLQAHILNTLGIVLSELNDFAGAIERYERAIAIRNDLNGPRHVETSVPIANKGRLLYKIGRFDEALPLLESSYRIADEELDSNHPWIPPRAINLARAYMHFGRFEDAEPLFRRALRIDRAVFGERHHYVASSLANLAALKHESGETVEAVELLEEAQAIELEALGEDHPNLARTRTWLANSYIELGRYEEAESALAAASPILREAYPGDHLHVADLSVELGDLYLATGRTEAALQHLESALAMFRRLFADDVSRLPAPAFGRARALIALGRTEEAADQFREGLAYAEDTNFPSSRLAQRYQQYSALLSRLNRNDDAMQAKERAAELLATAD